MTETKLVGKVVLEYLDRFPNTSSQCLSRIIYRDNVALFRDSEHARTVIRYYRGANGDRDRKKIKNRHDKQI